MLREIGRVRIAGEFGVTDGGVIGEPAGLLRLEELLSLAELVELLEWR